MIVEALLTEAGLALGLDGEDAALAATMVVVVNDARGLKVNKVIRNVDDLLDAAGSFSGRKTQAGENTIHGNVDDVFDSITEGGEALNSGAVRMGDGKVVHQHVSRDTGQRTITIDQEGQKQRKVRFEHQ